MIDYIASILVRALNLLFSFIPISASLWIGRRVGSLIFVFNKKRRLIAYANLKAALGKELSPQDLRKINKRVYQNMAQTFIEVLNLTRVSGKYIETYVDVVNMHRMEKAAACKRGIILLTGHFGNWELANLVGALKGYPMVILAREQKMKRLNELLNRLRESKGCTVIRKGITTRNILRALLKNQIVATLADQDAGKRGVFVNFFGRPASTAPGTIVFARRTEAIVVSNFIVRTGGPYHKLFIEEAVDFKGSQDADIKEHLQRYIAILEAYIRKYPDQWLWMHKRWKSTPVKTVLILHDRKQGHLNQSLAVARQIQKARAQTQGYATEDTNIVIAEVAFRSSFKRGLLTAASLISDWRCHGCMKCMKFSLDRKTYQTLMGTYADFVISCGSSLAPVNIFMARECNAKNIVIMSPGSIPKDKFSLAIIPKHDNPALRKNVLVTDLAPNLVDEERTAFYRRKFTDKLKLDEGRPRIGLLIGGDNARFMLKEPLMNRVLDEIVKVSEDLSGELFVTTSRRTSSPVARLLKERLQKNRRCKFLVIANEENPEGAVEGILSLSDVVVVSGESVSMVSEAINALKPVIAFELEKKGALGRSKYESAIRYFEKEGYLRILRPEAMADGITAAVKNAAAVKKPDDAVRIYEAVRRLI